MKTHSKRVTMLDPRAREVGKRWRAVEERQGRKTKKGFAFFLRLAQKKMTQARRARIMGISRQACDLLDDKYLVGLLGPRSERPYHCRRKRMALSEQVRRARKEVMGVPVMNAVVRSARGARCRVEFEPTASRLCLKYRSNVIILNGRRWPIVFATQEFLPRKNNSTAYSRFTVLESQLEDAAGVVCCYLPTTGNAQIYVFDAAFLRSRTFGGNPRRTSVYPRITPEAPDTRGESGEYEKFLRAWHLTKR